MLTGKLVTLMAFGGKLIERRVVDDRGSVILICREEEFKAAFVENRAPIVVGFPRSSVVSEEEVYTDLTG